MHGIRRTAYISNSCCMYNVAGQIFVDTLFCFKNLTAMNLAFANMVKYYMCSVCNESKFSTEIIEEISIILEDCITKIMNLLSDHSSKLIFKFQILGISLVWRYCHCHLSLSSCYHQHICVNQIKDQVHSSQLPNYDIKVSIF